MKRLREPDLRLLCERCGYHLKGLKRTDVCPECGKPVEESLPGKRVGSAWQQRPGWKSWWRTERRLERAPLAIWSTLAMGGTRDWGLLLLNCAIAGTALHVVAEFIARLLFWDWDRVGGSIVMVGATSTAVFVVTLALTAIEAVGIAFIAGRRGWRLSRGARLAILAHASYGWVLFSVLSVGTYVVLLWMPDVVPSRSPFKWLSLLLIALQFAVPLLVFETLVYIGMQRMKYANPPGSERELGEDPPTAPDGPGSVPSHPTDPPPGHPA